MSSKAEEFDQLVRDVFAPVYPVIAEQFLTRSEITGGVCLDLGCGSGYLGMALAGQSDLSVFLIDNDPEMLAIAQQNVNERQLGKKATVMLADVHKIPFASGTIQLVVSRGSVFFWQDQLQAFQEIYRVMAPGGMAFIGGGFGTPELKKRIDQEMLQRNPDWSEHLRKNIGPDAPEKFRSVMAETGIADFQIDHGPAGMWIIMKKQ